MSENDRKNERKNEPTAIFRKKCSLCDGSMLDSCLKLPDTPLANDFTKNVEETLDLYPLELLMCADCRHVQTSVVVLPERLFRDYVYATSTSPLTLAHLTKQAEAILDLYPGEVPAIMEVGSNDGALGKALVELGFPSELYVGVEPSTTMAKAAEEAGVNTVCRFFGRDLVKEMVLEAVAGEKMVFGRGNEWQDAWSDCPHPDVIVANNVFAHVPSVKEALEAVKMLLEDSFGVLVMDVAWAADIFVGLAFDTIYHEHMSYHTLGPLMRALGAIQMEVFDVDVMPEQVGRGSLRVFASAEGKRPVQLQKISKVLIEEKRLGLHLIAPWKAMEAEISVVGERLRFYLDECSKAGKVVWGYGAPAKLTTLLYACKVDSGKVAAIADDSPWKQGLFTPGMKIPVVSPAEIYKKKPDVVVVFAWNFADDIVRKLREGGYRGEIYRPLPIENIWVASC